MVREHPQAAFLAITKILGYQIVVPLVEDPNGSIVRYFQKGKLDKKGKRVPAEKVDYPAKFDRVTFSFRFKPGDKAVYFHADTILTAA